jgi:hypothetical protein
VDGEAAGMVTNHVYLGSAHINATFFSRISRPQTQIFGYDSSNIKIIEDTGMSLFNITIQ